MISKTIQRSINSHLLWCTEHAMTGLQTRSASTTCLEAFQRPIDEQLDLQARHLRTVPRNNDFAIKVPQNNNTQISDHQNAKRRRSGTYSHQTTLSSFFRPLWNHFSHLRAYHLSSESKAIVSQNANLVSLESGKMRGRSIACLDINR